MGRRKRVDEGLSEKRRAAGRKGGLSLRQKYLDLLSKYEAIFGKQNGVDFGKQNERAGKAKNRVLERANGDIGATKVTPKRPRKTPSGGVGGVQQPPCKIPVKVKTNCKDNSSTKKTGRVRNEIWDAVCEVFKLDPVTKAEQKKIGGIVRDLKLKGATPDEIRIRAERYRVLYPGPRFFTATAVLAHWDRLAEPILFGGSRVQAKPGKYDKVATIDLRGPEPQVLPAEAEAPDLADADQDPPFESDRQTIAGDDDIPF